MIKRGVNESIKIKSKNAAGTLTLLEVNSLWSRLSLGFGDLTVNFWQRIGQDFVIGSPCGEVKIKLSNTRNRGSVNFNIYAPTPINIYKN